MITGPPYAIYSIKPALGPLTGKTHVKILGDGFKDSSSIMVRFDSGKANSPEVAGNFLSEKEIWCETPNFETIGPKVSKVTLVMGKSDYTITSSNFSYFLNTKAEACICYGPGVLSENLVGAETVIVIQARNTDGKNRSSGADEFDVVIEDPNSVPE